MAASSWTLVLLGVIFFAIWKRLRSLAGLLPLPPGPQGSLFYGVKKLLPAVEPWKTYAAWSKDAESEDTLYDMEHYLM